MNVQEVLACFSEDENLYIVMPLASCDLQRELNRRQKEQKHFDEKEILTMFTQICLGLRYVHLQSIIHRDIKPGNILINKQS